MSASGPKLEPPPFPPWTQPKLYQDMIRSSSMYDSIVSVARSFAVCTQHSLSNRDHKNEPHLVKSVQGSGVWEFTAFKNENTGTHISAPWRCRDMAPQRRRGRVACTNLVSKGVWGV